MLKSKSDFVYEIFKGSDLGMNKSPIDHFVIRVDNLPEALKCYREVKQECLDQSKQPEKELIRYYCYMVEVNLKSRIIGHKDGKNINNGYFSKTLFANSYTQRPKMHDYITNIENGKVIRKKQILDEGLYEKL